MAASKYDIFQNKNGRLLTQMFGHDNACLNAQNYADKLQETVCISSNEGPISFFYPAVSKYYKPQTVLARDWELDGWSQFDYETMTAEMAVLRCLSFNLDQDMILGGSFTPQELRKVIKLLQAGINRLTLVEKAYL